MSKGELFPINLYDSKAIELLQRYYEMKIPNIDTIETGEQSIEAIVDDEDVSLLEETIKVGSI